MSIATDVEAVCAAVRDQRGDLDELIDVHVRRIAPLATSEEREETRRAAHARLAGLDALDPLLADPTVDEVLVNGDRIWVDRAGTIEAAGTLEGTAVERLIERILAPIGRRVDRTSPIVDARLADGSRVCAVVAPVAVDGPALSIRRFAPHARTLSDFTDAEGLELVTEVVAQRCNVVTSGATSSGKTSLLAAMLTRVDDAERIVVLEDTSELPCDAPHLVRLEARPGNADGLRPISLIDLVAAALRLRPDRLVVGEVRSAECLALVQAMNTGHDGSLSTCHANGPLDALLRLESLVLQAAPQWPLGAARRQLARSIDVIVHVQRAGSARQIASISEVVVPDEGEPAGTRLLGETIDGRFVRHGVLERGRA